MLTLKLVRLIEKHSEELAEGRRKKFSCRSVPLTSERFRRQNWNWQRQRSIAT